MLYLYADLCGEISDDRKTWVVQTTPCKVCSRPIRQSSPVPYIGATWSYPMATFVIMEKPSRVDIELCERCGVA